MNTTVMYYILIRYYYYEGTLYAPDDGPMASGKCGHDDRGRSTERPMLFDSVQLARDYLATLHITVQLSPQMYCLDGTYVLAHGEYDRPDYWIRKCRIGGE